MSDKYNKYASISTSKISSLNDLKKFGLKNISNIFKKEYTYLNFINNMEKKKALDKDWQYKINKYNFRETWNFDSSKEKIGFFGCSFTFGEGVKHEETFVNIVSEKLDLNAFNFGVGGSSIHRIIMTFNAVIKLIKINYAIFTLPHWRRQMYINSNGEIVNIIPNWPHLNFEKINKKLTELDDDYYIIQTISFLTLIYDLAKANGIKIILSSWDKEVNNLCKTLYPEITINTFDIIDKARDDMHPGKESHEQYANEIINAMNLFLK